MCRIASANASVYNFKIMVDPDYFKSKEEKEFEKKHKKEDERDQNVIMFFTILFYAAGFILLFIAIYKIFAG